MSVDSIVRLSPENGEVTNVEWNPEDVGPEGFEEVETTCFRSADEKLFGGHWAGEPGSLRLDPYPYDEICVMISGRVALVDGDGARREFGPGEAFYVPKGKSYTWETIEPSKKFFIAYEGVGS